MTHVSIDVPEELAPTIRAVVEHFSTYREAVQSDTADVSFAEAEAEWSDRVAQLETTGLMGMLAALDPKCSRIEMDGRPYRRLNQPSAGTYSGLRGETRVERGLYREMGVKNGPTIVPMELRAGIVEGRYTPAAANAAAHLAQALPSREADAVANAMNVLPHSRSAQFRAGVALGTAWDALPDDVTTRVADAMRIPDKAAAVSVSADRVSMPMAEPREPTPDDIERGVKNPISVNFRMAFAGVTTLYDSEGAPLLAIRHAHVPTGGRRAVEAALREDLERLTRRRPDLKVVALSDGAPEMQSIVDRAVAGHEVAARLTDFWHLAEHLGKAIASTGRYVTDLLSDWQCELLEDDTAIDGIETELRAWAQGYDSDALPEGLYDALTFIENRRERLRYASVHAANLPIGSGTVEATCKTIVETRMKRAGSRWKEVGGQAILALRALATSTGHRWESAMAELLASYRATITLLPEPIRH